MKNKMLERIKKDDKNTKLEEGVFDICFILVVKHLTS